MPLFIFSIMSRPFLSWLINTFILLQHLQATFLTPQLMLFKEFARRFCLRGQFADLEHRPAEVERDAKVDKSSECVVLRNFHALPLYRAAV